jgi:hypothetical protein
MPIIVDPSIATLIGSAATAFTVAAPAVAAADGNGRGYR